MRGCVVVVVTVINGDWLEVVPVMVAAPVVEEGTITLFVATVSAVSMRSEAGTPTPDTAFRGFDVLTFGGFRRGLDGSPIDRDARAELRLVEAHALSHTASPVVRISVASAFQSGRY